MNVPLFKRVLLRVLEERTTVSRPRIGGRELYDVFVKQPEVLAFRHQHHPESPESQPTAAQDKGKKKAAPGAEKGVESITPPTRTFVRKVLLPRLLQTGKIEKIHRQEPATEEDIARLSKIRTKSGATLLSRYKPGQSIVLSKWYWRMIPPRPAHIIPLPKKPPVMKLTPEQELELRRKAGEFAHLNRNNRKRVMRNSLVEITARRVQERAEWNEVIDKLKAEYLNGLAEKKREKEMQARERRAERRREKLSSLGRDGAPSPTETVEAPQAHAPSL